MEKNKQQCFVSAVVYVRNAKDSIESFLRLIHSKLCSEFVSFEIICVDDASHDGSADAIRAVTPTLTDCAVSIITMSSFQGLESSMNAGADLAIGDFIYEFDRIVTDYPEDMIINVYKRAQEGFDIVAAGSDISRLSSRLFYRIINANAAVQYKLSTETFRILSRRALNRIRSMSRTTPYRKVLYANCGLKSDTLYYDSDTKHRRYGKGEKSDRRRTGIDALIIFTNVAYKIALVMTLIMIIATLFGGVYTLVVYLTGSPVPGYTTMMLLMSGSFFMLFAIMSIVIRYLSVLVGLVFRQSSYMVASVEKL